MKDLNMCSLEELIEQKKQLLFLMEVEEESYMIRKLRKARLKYINHLIKKYKSL
jgi:hypothetical protein